MTKTNVSVFLLIIGMVIFYFFVSNIQFDDLNARLRYISVRHLLLGASFFICVFGLRAYKWFWMFHKVLQIKVNYMSVFGFFSISQFLGLGAPARLGDLSIPFLMKHFKNIPVSRGFSLIIFDRIVEMFVLINLALISAFYIASGMNYGSWEVLPVFLGFIVLAAGGGFLILFSENLRRFIQKRLSGKAITDSLTGFFESLNLLRMRALWLLLLTILCWFMDSIMYYYLLSSVIPVRYVESMVALFLGTTAGLISFIPGGLGVTDFSVKELLLHFGYLSNEAITAALVTRVTGVFITLMLGGIFIVTNMLARKKNA